LHPLRSNISNISNMKIKITLDDPETKAVWETIQRAKREVESWPAWKRGDQPETEVKLTIHQRLKGTVVYPVGSIVRRSNGYSYEKQLNGKWVKLSNRCRLVRNIKSL